MLGIFVRALLHVQNVHLPLLVVFDDSWHAFMLDFVFVVLKLFIPREQRETSIDLVIPSLFVVVVPCQQNVLVPSSSLRWIESVQTGICSV